MSSNLEWEPVRRKTNGLDDALKFALRKRYPGGSVNTTLSHHDIPYLQGLRDAGIQDADKLIEAIEQYDDIEVREVY